MKARPKPRRARAPTVKARPATVRAARRTSPRSPVAKVRSQRPRSIGRPPLDRDRRVLSDDERLELAAATARADRQDDRLTASARAGHDGLRAERRLHTESSPALTGGDVDAKWQDAYAVGDEAPGGDNPTPDQDRVDDIGKALGIEYQDDQELMGGEEVVERDRRRWELDPASSEDWPHDKDKDKG